MSKLYNLARMTVASTGTGTITLGGAATVNGVLYLTFAQAGISNGDTVSYAIADVGASEIGTGVYTASGTTLTRNVTASTNANAAINMTAAAQVFITPRKEDIANLTEPNTFTNTTDATSSTAAAQIISGGVGIAKKLRMGDGIFPGPGTFSLGNAQVYTDPVRGIVITGMVGSAFDFGFYSGAGSEIVVNPTGTVNSQWAGYPLFAYTTAPPAGGAAGAGIKISSTSNFGIFFGSGVPTLSAAQGSLYLRTDGTASNRIYVNNNGTTGWTAY